MVTVAVARAVAVAAAVVTQAVAAAAAVVAAAAVTAAAVAEAAAGIAATVVSAMVAQLPERDREAGGRRGLGLYGSHSVSASSTYCGGR